MTIVSSANKSSLRVLIFDVTSVAELLMTTREFPDISFGKISAQPHTSLGMQDIIQRRRRDKHVQTEEGPTAEEV